MSGLWPGAIAEDRVRPHAFLYGVPIMHSDPAGLAHKRRQQELLTASLREQVEERRRAQALERQYWAKIEALSDASPPQSQPPPAPPPGRSSAGDPRPEQPPLAPTQRSISVAKRQFAVTLPVPKPPAITVCTESPFAHSTVPTPPAGFSMRHRGPAAAQRNAVFRDVRPRAGDPTARQSMPARLLQPSVVRSYDPDAAAVRLGTNSELVYPDGHMSPISSPREH